MGRGRERGIRAAYDPALGDGAERGFWLDLFRQSIDELGELMGLEVRRFGPLRAFAITSMARVPFFNLILGAGQPGSAEHLDCAIGWFESLGIRHRVPVTPGLADSLKVEDLLNHNAYERESGLIRFVRDVSPPDFFVPPWLEVDDFAEYGPDTEGFGDYATEAFELDHAAGVLFDALPGHDPWRCYTAIDEEEVGIGSGLLWMRDGVARLGLAATRDRARGLGAHKALLRRRIVEAALSGCRLVFAETEELLNDRGGPSTACVNLVRAGFKQVCTRSLWISPELDEDWMNT